MPILGLRQHQDQTGPPVSDYPRTGPSTAGRVSRRKSESPELVLFVGASVSDGAGEWTCESESDDFVNYLVSNIGFLFIFFTSVANMSHKTSISKICLKTREMFQKSKLI